MPLLLVDVLNDHPNLEQAGHGASLVSGEVRQIRRESRAAGPVRSRTASAVAAGHTPRGVCDGTATEVTAARMTLQGSNRFTDVICSAPGQMATEAGECLCGNGAAMGVSCAGAD